MVLTCKIKAGDIFGGHSVQVYWETLSNEEGTEGFSNFNIFSCPTGFSGQTCANVNVDCNDCVEGQGVCTSSNCGVDTCICNPGYQGPTCAIGRTWC